MMDGLFVSVVTAKDSLSFAPMVCVRGWANAFMEMEKLSAPFVMVRARFIGGRAGRIDNERTRLEGWQAQAARDHPAKRFLCFMP